MMFWLIASAIALTAAVVLLRPMLRRDSPLLGAGIARLLLIPVSSLLLYQGVGAPDGIGVQGTPHPPAAAADETDMEAMLAELEARLQANPDDLEGWMLLGRSYKAMQRYPEALVVLQKARALAPDDPLVAVELAEAMIFTSGPEGIDAEVRGLLESAVETAPDTQKGLWLLGVIESQAGNDAQALAYWERLLALLEPGSGVASAVQQQVDEARAMLGQEPVAGWAGVEATVTLAEDVGDLPESAVLYVIARDPSVPRPPLGAVRVPAPQFPVTVQLTDGNSMMPQRPISGVAEIEVLARLSLSGNPVAGPNDPQSVPAALNTAEAATIILNLAPVQP